MKKTIRLLLGSVVVLLISIVIKTVLFTSLQIKPESEILPVLGNESVGNLSKAITFPNISYDINSPIDTIAFEGFHKFISEAYQYNRRANRIMSFCDSQY